MINRLSQLVVNDSQGSSSSSEGRKADGDELNTIELNHLETLGKQMFKSKEATDQRFVNLFKVHKAFQSHVKIGFGGFDDEVLRQANASIGDVLKTVTEGIGFSHEFKLLKPKVEEFDKD